MMNLRIRKEVRMDLAAAEDKMRQKHVEEMERLERAIKKTDSKYLKNDYMKKLKEMRLELIEYDRFKSGKTKVGDRIKCASKDEAVDVMCRLGHEGYDTDFSYETIVYVEVLGLHK